MLGLAAGTSATAEIMLLTDVMLVEVETGTLTPDRSVLIRDGVIVEIGAVAEAAGATILDGDGRFLIPGLWDSHVHVFSSPEEPDTAFPLYLLNGIAGIRDMGVLWPIEAQKELRSFPNSRLPLRTV